MVYINSEYCEDDKCEIYFLKPDDYLIKKDGVIYTVLGTCVAVSFWDKEKKIGAMVHYRMSKFPSESINFNSGEKLINEMFLKYLKMGGEIKNTEANILGGMYVDKKIAKKIVEENISFAKDFLMSKKISIKNIKTGYTEALRIRFFVETGKTLIIKIPKS